MKKILIVFILCLFLLVGCASPKVLYSNRAVIDIDISELIEDDWFDYSYFWQMGKDENGKDLTIVTIYWTKPIYDALHEEWDNYEGVTTYVTDGKTWERMK